MEIYNKYFNIKESCFCELCKNKMKDVYYINNEIKEMDFIENLIGLCRECHNKAHNHIISVETLVLAHKYRMIETGKPINYDKFKTI